ncbi:hypothetical protein I4F81_002681 [Pyropia yezoensis]|uniref:Uncharacterized protein n=1 Tax=Pyropia yezoensis TaxID=2788 RepID=A0ACC3BRP3_PYRYE|nr:hypothetical protein I4F81_002681 [Neopyropia yezoensis]
MATLADLPLDVLEVVAYRLWKAEEWDTLRAMALTSRWIAAAVRPGALTWLRSAEIVPTIYHENRRTVWGGDAPLFVPPLCWGDMDLVWHDARPPPVPAEPDRRLLCCRLRRLQPAGEWLQGRIFRDHPTGMLMVGGEPPAAGGDAGGTVTVGGEPPPDPPRRAAQVAPAVVRLRLGGGTASAGALAAATGAHPELCRVRMSPLDGSPSDEVVDRLLSVATDADAEDDAMQLRDVCAAVVEGVGPLRVFFIEDLRREQGAGVGFVLRELSETFCAGFLISALD